MSEMCGKELKKHNVTCVSLWPGLVQTEAIVAAKESFEKTVGGVFFTIIVKMFSNIQHCMYIPRR